MKDRLGTLGQQKGQLSDKEFYRLFLKGHGWPADTEEDHFLDEMFDMELGCHAPAATSAGLRAG